MTIASHAVEIIRQGVWASLTGGWSYDPRQTLACNVVHMYLWLFLFVLPLLITLCFDFTWPVVGIYALIVGALFAILKVLNYYLHTIFDTHDPIDVVVVDTNADEEDEDEENGIRDVEQGVVMGDENQSDLDNRKTHSGGMVPTSTLHETLDEMISLRTFSSSGVGACADDDELEYATWESARGVASTGTAAAALQDAEVDAGGGRLKRRNARSKKSRKKSATNAPELDVAGPSGIGTAQTPSSPDYLAVEADVHSMPNEPIAKDEILDVDSVELRTVRSDSKLPTSAIAQGGSSGLMTAEIEITPGRKHEQSPGGKRILFQSNDIEICRSDDEEDRFGEEKENYDVAENEGAVASSTSSLTWFNRKYSEPEFVTTEQGKTCEGQESQEIEERRRDSFDRSGKKRRSGKRVAISPTDIGGNTVRRTRSTVETCVQRGTSGRDEGGGVGTASTSSTLLSETCLEKCRGKGVRKSYPGKTSSTDIFLLQHRKHPGASDGFGSMTRESNSVGSCGTGLEEASFVGCDEISGGSQKVGGAGEKLESNMLSVGRVSRFHSVDVPLTDIPERESEYDRHDAFGDADAADSTAQLSASNMDTSQTAAMTISQSTTDPYGTSRSDGGRGTTVSFYATASEDSPPITRMRAGSSEPIHKGQRHWTSTEDESPESPRRKLIQNLRDTLETLKSETSTTGSSTGTAVGQTDRFVVDLQALKDASTPDLRWLFDDAAAVLNATSSYRHAVSSSSAGSSPVTRPRLASLHGHELALPSTSSKRDVETEQLHPMSQKSRRPDSPMPDRPDAMLIQQQFRERLMEEIKRLLEEIIDSHPEALEAIESVRQAKLGRLARRAVAGVDGTASGGIPAVVADSYMGDDEEGYMDAATIEDADAPGPSHRGYGDRRAVPKHGRSRQGQKGSVGTERVASEDGETDTEGPADADEDDNALSGRIRRDSFGNRTPSIRYTTSRAETGENLALAELVRRRNVHVARSHDDTTEGAVHYFQDSDGKWYTYMFNDEGVATPQLLGSDRALMELIAEQQEEAEVRAARIQGRGGRSKSGTSVNSDRKRDRKMDVLSGSRRRQQQSQAISRSGYRGQQRQGPHPLKIVLARTGSSSSEESFLQLDAPASILHVGGGRAGSRTPAVEAPGSGRVTLPLRLHRRLSGGGPSGAVAMTPTSVSGQQRTSGAREFRLRQMLNRSGYGSVQFSTTGGSLSLMPRLDSGPGTSFINTPFPHHHDDLATPGDYPTVALSSSNFLALSGSLQTPSDLSHASFRARFLATLAGGVDVLPSMIGTGNALGVSGPGQIMSTAPSVKRKQYYRVPICPRLGVCCCPKWLTSRLMAWKFWGRTDDQGGEGSLSSSGWRCCPKRTFKLRLDRLRLMAMFDRNRTKFSAFIDVLLAILVTFVACGVLSRPLYYDFSFVMACVVTAGAQFSLMKSVQPDAASPVHGYNALAAYSRPVYYCLFGLIVYVFDRFYAFHPSNPYATETLYSTWPNMWEFWWNSLKDFWATFFLLLPIIFTFGLLPQLNTFVIYVLEQVDMLVFGGTASVGLASGIFAVSRSVVCSSILFVISYFAMQHQSPRPTRNVIFSAFCGCVVALSYLLSRSSSDPRLLGALLSCFRKSVCWSRMSTGDRQDGNVTSDEDDSSAFESGAKDDNRRCDAAQQRRKSTATEDPLPAQLRETVILRMKHDAMAALLSGVLYFALHCSTAFTVFKSTLAIVLPSIAVGVGIVSHYLLPQLRQHTPWRILASPILKTYEHRIFDVDSMARLMPFERLYAALNLLERNVLYPLVILHFVTVSGEELEKRYGIYFACAIMTIASMKLLRTAYCNAAQLYLPLGVAVLFSFVDFPSLSFTPLLDFYLVALVYPKFLELMLKLQFIFSYVAPWQISWGSAFHAFAQPTAIPHSAFTLAITAISSFLSAPLNPFLGSAVFLMSYARPVKFWEKNYNTKRVDHSNTRLISQIDRGPMTDDSNLNAIFYEHLTRSLQRSLAGDLQLGRLATTVNAGDCFILASFYLNCLVHVVEVGNGFVTFQLRGLEFRGTYCQQREVEAISEEIGDQGCCCCGGDGGAATNCCCIRGFLSLNAVWNLSWLSWRVTASKFVLEGYSVSDNSALSLLQLIELRKLLVTLYVKCILFYTLKSAKLDEWLCTEAIVAALEPITKDPKYADVDPSFCAANDEDYDCRMNGISRQSFCQHFLPWIEYCYGRRRRPSTTTPADENGEANCCEKDSLLAALCFGMALVGRRVLGAAAQGRHTSGAESFLYGLHALFKGDFRITCSRDEWVFADMDILKSVVAPAVRMALKLHQDHFTAPEDFESMEYLFESIDHYDRTIFISHENDPAWRHAVLTNTRSLLALRHVFEDGQDDFKIIMLNRRHMNFRVIALNKECVRAFWAGQQQELIFLRNRNPERGSIQNARQVLRNMINSSADQPIGYPIYVSPLTTSFCETHEQISTCTGPPLTVDLISRCCVRLWRRLTERCGTSGSSNMNTASAPAPTPPAAGLVQFRSSSSVFGGSGMAETSFTERRHIELRHQPTTSRTRPTPRPRTSLLNAVNRRGDRGPSGTGRGAASGSRGQGTSAYRPPHPPPRHGSAPPIMQRSMTHPLPPLPDVLLPSRLFRHYENRYNEYSLNRSPQTLPLSSLRPRGDSLTLRPTTPKNSVVAAGGGSAADSDAKPRVSLGSLLALNAGDYAEAALSSAAGPSTGRRGERVRITDVSAVLDNLDQVSSGPSHVVWPVEDWIRRGGRHGWKGWRPEKGIEGSVVHKWIPGHANIKHRCNLDKVVLLINILDGKYYVPIVEQGVEWIGDEL